MKMESNHIDDIFRRRLHDTETPPPAFVWNNVERELKKRKRRVLFFWIFALGLAGAGLWAMLPPIKGAQSGATDLTRHETPGNQTLAADKSPAKNTSYAGIPAETPAPASRIHHPTADKNGRPALPAITLPVPAEPQVEKSTMEDGLPNAFDGAIPPRIGSLEALAAKPEETSLVFRRGQILPKAKGFIRKKKDPKYCYNFAENPNVWMLEAYAGPSFNQRTLEAGIPAFDSYAQLRRSTEQPDWSFHAGIRGALLLKRHWLLRTGLHYEQMTEVFEYADPSYIKYLVEIINQPGEPTIIDTIGVEYGENYVKTFNRFGMLDVPLEMGAELRSGRFGLSLHAGLAFNVLFWKRGTILSPSMQPTPFTPGENGATEVFRTRTGLSASGSAQLFVHLKPTVRVFAEPYYRKVLKPATLDNQAVDTRFSNWGIKFGMTKILN